MNTLTRLALAIGLLASALMGSACSTVGEKEFSCPGRPPGVHCMSATEVYEATQSTDTVAPTASKPMGDAPKSTGRRARSTREGQGATTSKHRKGESPAQQPQPHSELDTLRTSLMVPATDKPIPIRTPAQIMRVWIAPWEDSRGVLHAGGYAFVEVESRRWSFGEAQTTTEPVRFFSIQHNAVDTKESVGKDHSASNERGGTSERVKRTSTLPKETSNEPSAPERRR